MQKEIQKISFSMTAGVIEKFTLTCQSRLKEKGHLLIEDGKATVVGTVLATVFYEKASFDLDEPDGGYLSDQEVEWLQKILDGIKKEIFHQGEGWISFRKDDIRIVIHYQ